MSQRCSSHWSFTVLYVYRLTRFITFFETAATVLGFLTFPSRSLINRESSISTFPWSLTSQPKLISLFIKPWSLIKSGPCSAPDFGWNKIIFHKLFYTHTKKTVLVSYANREVSDQPVHPGILYSLIYSTISTDLLSITNLSNMRETNAQIRLRICAAWSEHSFLTYSMSFLSHVKTHVIVWTIFLPRHNG